jgi:GTP cyclohydrolase I
MGSDAPVAQVPASSLNGVDHYGARCAVRTLLRHIGEDPDRNGLADTPDRVLKALSDMTSGYHMTPGEILAKTFEVPHQEMVLLKDVAFTSLCEHHLLPFLGTASLAYIPNPQTGRIVGISKLARLVDCIARRLQVQERLTTQLAEAIMDHLQPQGVGVVLKATHLCMVCRGVRQPTSQMVTSAVRGVLFQEHNARAEFLHLLA